MRCPNCDREVAGPDLPRHYSVCSGGGANAPERELRQGQQERWTGTTALAAEETARPLASGLPLVFVIASQAAQTIDATGTRYYRVEEWSFLYSNGRNGDAVAVAVGPSGAKAREGDIDRWKFWAQSPPIRNWRIDSDGAQEIGRLSGGELLPPGSVFGGPAIFSLRMGDVEGSSTPIWSLPYRFVTEPRYVCADTGNVAVLSTAMPEQFREESNAHKATESGDAFQSSDDFDVFVSYRRKDRRWVENKLLPKLRSWGITYGVDFAHFDDALSFETEMGRLIRKSRQTLAVLTGDWPRSPFTMFEADASSGRIIVIRLDECPLPVLPGGSQVIDLTRLNVDSEWETLRRAIDEVKLESSDLRPLYEVKLESSGLQPLYAAISFSRGEPSVAAFERLPFSQYMITTEVENKTDTEYIFDSLVFTLITSPAKQERERLIDMVRVVLIGDRTVTEYGRYTPYRAEEGSAVRLAPGKSMTIPEISLGNTAATVAGHQVVELSVSLALADLPTVESCRCAVPPLTRLADTGRPALSFPCLPVSRLPTPSGMVESGTRSQILHAARSFAKDALLHMVAPHRVAISGTDHGYAALYLADSWYCTFSSEAKDCTFQISLDDPGWITEDGIVRGHLRRKNWLSELHLESCRVDSRLAYLIGLQSGCSPPASTLAAVDVAGQQRPLERLALVLEEIQGRWRCLWLLPFGLPGDERVAIRADTGEVCSFRDGSWNMLSDSIWNLYSAPKEE